MASRRLFDGAQIEIGSLPIVGAGAGAYTITADGGVYAYSGNNATLTYTPLGGFTLSADGGVFSYAGNDANLLFKKLLSADGGTYSYSGNNATLRFSRVIAAGGGAYSYSGNNATLTYTQAGAFVLSADGGTYSYTGNNANLIFSRLLAADGGIYSYSGNNADLTYVPFSGAYTIIADGGVYSYSGNNANFLYTGQQPDAVGGGNPKGYKREYQPTYYELKKQRDIERKFQEAELSLKVVESKIEAVDIKRNRDLADEALQIELIALLSEQNELGQLIERLQQQRLMALRDDDEVLALLMHLI
jgi:hypothetical protein